MNTLANVWLTLTVLVIVVALIVEGVQRCARAVQRCANWVRRVRVYKIGQTPAPPPVIINLPPQK